MLVPLELKFGFSLAKTKKEKTAPSPPFLDPRHGPSGHHGESKCTAILGHTRVYFRLLDRPKSSLIKSRWKLAQLVCDSRRSLCFSCTWPLVKAVPVTSAGCGALTHHPTGISCFSFA